MEASGRVDDRRRSGHAQTSGQIDLGVDRGLAGDGARIRAVHGVRQSELGVRSAARAFCLAVGVAVSTRARQQQVPHADAFHIFIKLLIFVACSDHLYPVASFNQSLGQVI